MNALEFLGALGEGSNHVDSMYFPEDILQLEEARSLMGQLQLPEEHWKDLLRRFLLYPP